MFLCYSDSVERTKKKKRMDSCGKSSFLVPQEKGSCPSIGSVLDGYLINCCSLCGFNEKLEGETCFEMINALLGDLDDTEEVVIEDDVLDRLPMDPFGMNITAFSDWIEDFEWGFRPLDVEFEVDETHEKIGDHDHLHFLGLSWDFNGPENLQPQTVDAKGNDMLVSGDVFNGYQNFDVVFDEGIVADGSTRGFLSVSQRHGDYRVQSKEAEESRNYTKIECDAEGGFPHDALFFVLGYLGVRDLLSVEGVCRSLCDAVRGDPLLWRTMHIDQPLNERITDDTLVKLTNRAQGTLQHLALVNCLWITDSGLGRVLQSNPRLMKVSICNMIQNLARTYLFIAVVLT